MASERDRVTVWTLKNATPLDGSTNTSWHRQTSAPPVDSSWTAEHVETNEESQISITRVASWGPDCRKWLFSEVRGGIWTPHSPVLIKISADKRPLNQLTVKKIFFSLFIKTFFLQHHHIVHEKTINLSAWMKEICTLLVKLHIIFSRMQRVNQHARPSIIQVGCPTCCYQVCALDHANVGTSELD